jgi:hypothetical protein
MMFLARATTINQINAILKTHPNAQEDFILEQLKEKGISRKAFLNEYISHESFGVCIAYGTAEGYYKEESDRLKPSFIEFLNGKKPYFHLNEEILKELIANEKPKKLKKRA